MNKTELEDAVKEKLGKTLMVARKNRKIDMVEALKNAE